MRLIDADAIKYEPLPKGERNYRTYNLDDAYEDGYNDAMVDVRNAPTIEDRKKGKWEKCGRLEGKVVMKCSNCGQGITAMFSPEYHYCPNCGADMEE